MQTRTKKLTVLAVLSALAYIVMMVGRIPIVMFLKYDPADVIITIGGFLYGPLSAFAISTVVSFVEMLTVSDTGIIGLVMNIISTCSFACTASCIYKSKRTITRAIIGLIAGWLLTTAVMLLWNYFIAPIYMRIPREEVANLLIPAFLPFNLLKGGLNAAMTMLLYKPIKRALYKSRLMLVSEEPAAITGKVNIGTILVSSFILITCVLLILVFQGHI
jgi:riboflavin transporter FmnP